MTIKNTPSLREKKHAWTRKNILDAFLEKLKTKNIQDISIRELCETAQISPGTFFNYFSHKQELLAYFIWLWRVKATQQIEQEKTPTKAIEIIFTAAAEDLFCYHHNINEIIACLAPGATATEPQKISHAKTTQTFFDQNKTNHSASQNLDATLLTLIKKIIKNNKSRKNVSEETLLLMVQTIFFGVPLMIKKNSDKIKKSYQQLLAKTWHCLELQ
ncbi:MAG: TetR/AcrR family transcriptional regulator [Candidatus Buchananbacteria bacterium]|nr:TetR/AcrR family transcriptional regulator [Candidatus Buchananbacteria bacterium]